MFTKCQARLLCLSLPPIVPNLCFVVVFARLPYAAVLNVYSKIFALPYFYVHTHTPPWKWKTTAPPGERERDTTPT